MIELRIFNLKTFGNEIDFLDTLPVFNVSARACIEGERYGEDLSCIKCPEGSYLYLA